MALQTGAGLSRIIILVGAGYTGTVLFKNGKLSDVLGELQSLVKGLEKDGLLSEADPDYSDAIASQVRRLAMEVQQLASARHTILVNGAVGSYNTGIIPPLLVPAAALGALGYGYMWWKGLSFSDLMYVTKSNMANAVSNLTKHLEHVSDALAATKRHLTQRIENLDGKLDDQVEISKLIKDEVTDIRGDLSQIGYDLDALQRMVSGLMLDERKAKVGSGIVLNSGLCKPELHIEGAITTQRIMDGKICSLEDKQDIANKGVSYLCNFVDGRKMKMPQVIQEQLRLSGNSRGYLTSSETSSLMGLKEIVDSSVSGNASMSITDGTFQDSSDELGDLPQSPRT